MGRAADVPKPLRIGVAATDVGGVTIRLGSIGPLTRTCQAFCEIMTMRASSVNVTKVTWGNGKRPVNGQDGRRRTEETHEPPLLNDRVQEIVGCSE